MAWYTAKCLYRLLGPGTDEGSTMLGEYRYFLVKAESDDEAHARSRQIGREKEHSYTNALGGLTEWKFEGVVDVKEILSSDIVEKAEVYHEYIP